MIKGQPLLPRSGRMLTLPTPMQYSLGIRTSALQENQKPKEQAEKEQAEKEQAKKEAAKLFFLMGDRITHSEKSKESRINA